MGLRRHTILLLSIMGMLLFIAGFGVYVAMGVELHHAGFALMGIGAALDGIAWSGSLGRTAKADHWLWFLVILLLFPLSPLIYSILGPE